MKKRGASTATLIGTLIVGLLIGAGVIYAAAPSIGLVATTTVGGGTNTVTTTVGGGTNTVTTTVSGAGGGLCNGQTLTIGALNDLSGDLSAQGKGDLAAEQIAISDVNAYLQSTGCNLKFALNAVDYKLDTPTALQQLQAFGAAGIQAVVGPLNSGTAAGILSYANSNHIVLISPSSTSPALAIAGDYLFRTAPNDAAQGQADARMMVAMGAKAAILINRDDTYGNGLANATKSFLMQDGISASNIAGPYKYDTQTSDFSALISQISSSYTSLSGSVGADHVAIFSVSFQEIGTLLLQVKNAAPQLLSTTLPWYGTDGDAQNSLLTNSTTGPTVSQVRLPSTLFNVVNNSKTLDFFNKWKGTPQLAAIVGGATFYTLEGYDDVWLAALSTLSCGKYDGTCIHAILPSVAANFFGLTGWEGLQASGDRIPGSYNIWSVTASGSAYGWRLAGTWDYSSDSVTWTNNTPP